MKTMHREAKHGIHIRIVFIYYSGLFVRSKSGSKRKQLNSSGGDNLDNKICNEQTRSSVKYLDIPFHQVECTNLMQKSSHIATFWWVLNGAVSSNIARWTCVCVHLDAVMRCNATLHIHQSKQLRAKENGWMAADCNPSDTTSFILVTQPITNCQVFEKTVLELPLLLLTPT